MNTSIVSEAILAGYKHFLERVKLKFPHDLSETEERLILEKDQFGVKAWRSLRSKWVATRLFEVMVKGKKIKLSFGKANGLLTDQNRATRESATKSIYSRLIEDGEIFASAFRNVMNDWINICKIRKYTSTMQASLITNDTDRATIDNLVKKIEDNVLLVRRYLELKSKLMDLPKLSCQDINAPLPCAYATFSYEQAKELITRAYRQFDEDFAAKVQDMFEKKHINYMPKFGKKNEAWCSPWYSGKSAFIMINFNGSLNDIFTLAHELGHATYYYYAQRDQTLMNLNTPPIVGETASTFGELLLAETLLNEAKSIDEKKAVLCSILDRSSLTIFHVIARFFFEKSLYDFAEKDNYLEFETICKKWVSARNKIYGNVVEWFSEMKAEWAITPHYYTDNLRFYNYPYAYSQLLVFALYEIYREDRKRFVPKFKHALSMGSSDKPCRNWKTFRFRCRITGLLAAWIKKIFFICQRTSSEFIMIFSIYTHAPTSD